jgi:hypothetical protein
MKAVKGGKGHMVGKTGSGPSRPNQMANKGGGPKMNGGGRGKMVGFTGSRPAKAC